MCPLCAAASLGWSRTEEAGISADNQAALTQRARDYTEAWVGEDDALQAARRRGQELGAVPIGPGGGAVLRFLAAALGARAVVEVGTGAGVSGIYLLRGMAGDGVLTSIDLEGEHQRVAKQSFTEAGIPSGRARLITGRALDVLPRLTDGVYDLVFCDAAKAEYGDYLRESLRLLRPGGVIAFDNALWHGRVPDPSHRDAETVAVRELLRQVHDDERLTPVLLGAGDGLLAAVLRA
jgi:predicted O-methyltransferase YrrM